jgi:hypothetical protein
MKENPKIKNLLNKLKSWFTSNKEIARIRVVTSKQAFWVSNPKKIKFWKGFCEKQSAALLMSSDDVALPARITKVIYKSQ